MSIGSAPNRYRSGSPCVATAEPRLDAWVEPALRLLLSAADGGSAPARAGSSAPTGHDQLEALRTRRIDSLAYLTGRPDAAWQRLYDKVWETQSQALFEVSTALSEEGVEPLLFKGAELVPRFFRGHAIGLMRDLDFLVARDQLARAKRTLFTLGFRQARFDPETGELTEHDPIEVAEVESNHYELVAFVQPRTRPDLDADEKQLAAQVAAPPLWVHDGRVTVVVEIDLHHQVAVDIPSKGFFSRSIPSAHGFGLAMSDTDHLWVIASRYYVEVAQHGKRKLRDLAYLAPLLARCEIDWDLVLTVCEEYKLHSSLYYHLAFLDALLGGVVPEAYLAKLEPRGDRRLRDWGWQLAPLFDFIDPMPLRWPSR